MLLVAIRSTSSAGAGALAAIGERGGKGGGIGTLAWGALADAAADDSALIAW